MSTREMEKADQEIIAVANKNHQAATSQENTPAATTKKNRKKQRALTLHIILCVLASAMFLAVLIDSRMVIWLVNFGVLTCGIVAAISIDRYLRRNKT